MWKSHIQPEEFYPLVESIIIANATTIAERGPKECPEIPLLKLLKLALFLRTVSDKVRAAGKTHPLLPGFNFREAAELIHAARRDIGRYWQEADDHLKEVELFLKDIPNADKDRCAPIGTKSATLEAWAA
jgi:hypothetical protein